MIVPVRSFNSSGLAAFKAWLDNPSATAPKSLLTDDTLTHPTDATYELDPERGFATSFDLGSYLTEQVFGEVSDRFSLLANYGMWSWISLTYIESLSRKRGRNPGAPLANAHYLYTPRLEYRLIARTAWDLTALYGEVARIALGSKTSPWGEMAEQMTSRQQIYANRSFWSIAHSLYATPDGTVKVGVTSQRNKEARHDPTSKAGLGGVRRLPFTFKQFERTYNLRIMDRDAISALLPAEYKKWRTAPNS